MQSCLDLETGVNKPFKNVSCQRRFQNFFQEGAPVFGFATFSSIIFFGDLILSNLSTKNDSRGVQGHATPQKFSKFAYCNGHFCAV